MLYLIALVYILLCVRLHVQLEASFENGTGSGALQAGVWRMILRREFVAAWEKRSLRFVPRSGKGKKTEEQNQARKFAGRMMRHLLVDSLRSGDFHQISIGLHLGLDDACETAVAAGAVRAVLCPLLASTGNLSACRLRIVPEFSGVCLRVQLRGIFSWQVGDIMLAALKCALRKRKEGLKWTSIPLRA